MHFQEKLVRCSDCGVNFTISVEQQLFSQSWGVSIEEKRCRSCCLKSKSEQYGSGIYGQSSRRQFKAKCARCGENTEVPFEPRAGRRVYCSDCYRKVKVCR